MSTDLDPRLEDAARRQLSRLLDAVEVGEPPATPRDDAHPLVVHVGDLHHGDRRRPEPRRRAVVAIAAAVAFLLGVGVAVALRPSGDGDGSSTPPATDPDPEAATEVPHLVPGHLPDGAEPLFGARLPLPADELDPGSADVTVYGRPSGDDPFAGGDLAVIVVEDETVGLVGTEATVRDGPGRVGESSEANDLGIRTLRDGAFHWVSWAETPDVEVTLASRSLTVEDLQALAEGAEVDGTTVVLRGGPRGLALVGTLQGLTFGGPHLVPGAAAGWYDVYRRADAGPSQASPELPPLEVVTFAGTEAELLAARWMVDAEPARIRRSDGWLSYPGDAEWIGEVTLLWEEAPGVIAITQQTGDIDTVEGYRPVG